MPNLSKQPKNGHIPRPVLREPNALVENVYAEPKTTSIPDLESQDTMGEFLIDRFNTDDASPKRRVVMVPTGMALPGIHRVPNGTKHISRWRKTQEWLISPKVAAIVTAGSLALFNGIGNSDVIAGSTQLAAHKAYRTFNPVEDQVIQEDRTVTVPGHTQTIVVTAKTSNEVGVIDVDPGAIQEFLEETFDAVQNGADITELEIIGNTSDEYGSEASIGVPNTENEIIGERRALKAYDALISAGLPIDESEVTIDYKEHILSTEQKNEALYVARAEGFDTTKEAIEAVDADEPVPDELRAIIEKLFTNDDVRGVSMSAEVTYPATESTATVTIERTIPGEDNPPSVPKARFFGLIPLPPIRRRERYTDIKDVNRWAFTPSKRLYKPTVIREDEDHAWVRLRPEAVKDDGTLVENAWAYSRKYEHLLRDNRIVDMLKATYKDPAGNSKALRVMFVDKAPAAETIEAFEELLQKFASMEDGKLGDRVSAIFVYPSKNAGTEHDDPKRIAMGLDKQRSEEILGTYAYALDLVELHMPSTWDSNELLEMFEEFNGPTWVMGHEVAGHGTSESDEELRLIPVRASNIANAYLIDGDPHAQKMSSLNKILSKLPQKQPHTPSIEFDISYPVLDANGETVTMHARVSEGDPRLAHASEATIVGYRPTRYAGKNAEEHYAETAAAVVTGIAIPYDEAGVEVPTLTTDQGNKAAFTKGYRPDTRGQKLFTDSVGATEGSYPVSFKNPADVAISHIAPANDRVVRDELTRTTRLKTLKPDEMVAILERFIRTKRQD